MKQGDTTVVDRWDEKARAFRHFLMRWTGHRFDEVSEVSADGTPFTEPVPPPMETDPDWLAAKRHARNVYANHGETGLALLIESLEQAARENPTGPEGHSPE